MKKVLISLFCAASITSSSISFEVHTGTADGNQADKSCITWKAEAKFVGYAYDHYVHIRNQCDSRFECQVKTDVNPDPITEIVPKQSEVSVLTYRGSPASTFKATVDCRAMTENPK